MRSILFALLLALAAITPAGAQEGSIRLVSANGFPPMMYEEAGTARGYAVTIAKAILEDGGFTVKTESMPWPRAQDEVINNQAVITGFSYNDERVRRGFLYSIVAFKDPVVVVVKADSPHAFEKPDDLIGKRVGNARGSSYGPAFEAIRPRLDLEEDSSDEQRLRKLLLGRIDYGIFSGGPAVLSYAQDQFKMRAADFKMFPNSLVEDDIYLAIGKNTPNAERIIDRINTSIRKLDANGTIRRLLAGG